MGHACKSFETSSMTMETQQGCADLLLHAVRQHTKSTLEVLFRTTSIDNLHDSDPLSWVSRHRSTLSIGKSCSTIGAQRWGRASVQLYSKLNVFYCAVDQISPHLHYPSKSKKVVADRIQRSIDDDIHICKRPVLYGRPSLPQIRAKVVRGVDKHVRCGRADVAAAAAWRGTQELNPDGGRIFESAVFSHAPNAVVPTHVRMQINSNLTANRDGGRNTKNGEQKHTGTKHLGFGGGQ